MNATPGVGLVERARALAPLIAGEADEIERTRRLTPAVVAALIENGLYRALLPQSLDGADDASIKACRSDDAAADAGGEDCTFAYQLPDGIRTEAAPDPFDNLVRVVLCVRLAQRMQNDLADAIGIVFARGPDRALHGSLN
ncbi:hypothetical protein GGD66_003157 [Bradyrhizobium sp. CIR48]|nr:hypothetical protein [Bradyrhizobium sp. CIR48]